MAIRLTESRLRQIIREEASKLTRRPVSRRTRRLRESDGSFQEYFDLIEIAAAEEGFFEMELDLEEAQRIVEETLADDFGDEVSDDMIFQFVDALAEKHEERFVPDDDDVSNDGSSLPGMY